MSGILDATAQQPTDRDRRRGYTSAQRTVGAAIAASQVELLREEQNSHERLSRRREARDRALRLGKKVKLSTRAMEAFIEAEGGKLDHSRIARIVADASPVPQVRRADKSE